MRREIIEENENEFHYLHQINLAFYVLCPTSVTSECKFSDMANILTPERLNMGDDVLEGLMHIKYADEEELEEIIDILINNVEKFKKIVNFLGITSN